MIAYSKVTVFYLESGVSDAAQVRLCCFNKPHGCHQSSAESFAASLVLTHVPVLEAFVFCSKEISCEELL